MPLSDFEKYLYSVLNNTCILLIHSDPTLADSDEDGYQDHNDPRPYLNDVRYYSILDEKYVPILDKAGNISYGGDQGWFSKDDWSSTDYKLNTQGCGTIAMSDLFLYMGISNMNYQNSITEIAYDSGSLKQEQYMNYVRKINSKYAKTSRWTGVIGPKLSAGINQYFSFADINYEASWRYTLTKSKMLDLITEMLEKDIPVIFSVGPNTPDFWGKVEIDLYKRLKPSDDGYDPNGNMLYQYYKSNTVNGHYMTITGVVIDEVDNSVMISVSSWGENYYINYDEYRDYIENEGGTWTSSMIYIK